MAITKNVTIKFSPTSSLDTIEKLKSILFLKKERYGEAVKEFENILRVCTVFSTERMAMLLNLGNAYYSLSQFSKALENYNAILELAEKVNGKDALEGKSAALGNIGLILKAKGDLDNALKYLLDALEIFNIAAPSLITKTLK